ncbi:MAG: serine/threonine protein kinase [Myxococcales bacterium]|nr:serine/threonine protein kinase [Myxococcales bacterium]
MSGVRFGKYLLGSRIARGGMAEIYLATAQGPQGFSKPVVIKRLHPHLAQREELVSLFLSEARVAAQLHHPHIVQIFDLGTQGGAYYICMEHLDGEDLASIVCRANEQGRKVPVDVAAKIGMAIADGLHHAHTLRHPSRVLRSIVHGDISPSNVVVTFLGEVKIVDFGIARAAGEIERVLPGVLKGKLSYSAPEQIAGGKSDPRADIFALGVVLHELATGERLFRRYTELGTMRALLDEPIPHPRTVRAELPDAFGSVIMRALERDRRLRFQSAEEMRVALTTFLASRPYAATRPQLAEFLRSIFGDAHLEARAATLREHSSTLVLPERAEPKAVQPAAVPLVAELPAGRSDRGWGRNGLVRVAGEVPAALLRAGFTMVAVPATVAAFALKWTRRRLTLAALAFGAAAFGLGLAAREIKEAAVRSATRASALAPAAQASADALSKGRPARAARAADPHLPSSPPAVRLPRRAAALPAPPSPLRDR